MFACVGARKFWSLKNRKTKHVVYFEVISTRHKIYHCSIIRTLCFACFYMASVVRVSLYICILQYMFKFASISPAGTCEHSRKIYRRSVVANAHQVGACALYYYRVVVLLCWWAVLCCSAANLNFCTVVCTLYINCMPYHVHKFRLYASKDKLIFCMIEL